MTPLAFLVFAVAYTLGSVPFGYLLVRFFRKEDIRSTGSGNIGATNVARSGAKGLGILTLLLDLGKGVVAVLLARHFFPAVAGSPSDLMVGAAIAAVLGHVFPLWLGFRGGKGVATALGVMLALSPRVALGAVVVFALIFALSRIVSLASVVAAATLPVLAFLLTRHASPVYLGGVVFLAVLVVAKHHANLRRLMAGTESRFGSKKATSAAVSANNTKARA